MSAPSGYATDTERLLHTNLFSNCTGSTYLVITAKLRVLIKFQYVGVVRTDNDRSWSRQLREASRRSATPEPGKASR